MKKIRIEFSMVHSVMFDYRGVTHLASGETIVCPGQARLIINNAEAVSPVPAEVDAAIAEAADEGEEALAWAIQEYVFPVGRARQEFNFRVGSGANSDEAC